MSDRPTPRPIKVLEQFIQVPRFWVDLMKPHCHKGKQHAPRIPASFWEYTFCLWRYIVNGNEPRATSMSMREFPVRKDAAVRWTAAYSVSGLYTVGKGRWTPQHDAPTFFQYRCDATEEDWRVFISALDLTLNRIKDAGIMDYVSVGAFRVALAGWVDELRRREGLPSINSQFLKEAPGHKDNKGRPIAEIDKQGIVQPIFYKNAKRLPWTNGHPRDCRCDECHESRQCYEAAVANDEIEA